MNFLLLGLSLEGVCLGLSLERPTILHEFLLEHRSNAIYAFRTLDIYAHPVRTYNSESTQEYLFSWRAYAREDFTFLGAFCKYGVGGGLGFTLTNSQVQLVDSSYLNGIATIDFYPTVAIYTQIQFNEINALKLVGSLDASQKFPFSGNLVLLFVMGL